MDVSLMEKFADPVMFETLTSSEKAMGALITTGMGMGITFLVLILLWGVIVLMSKGIAKAENKTAKGENIVKAAELRTAEIVQGEGQGLEDARLVAVITAAIEAYEAGSSCAGERFTVRKITRTGGNPWGAAGVADCTMSRRM